jgi:N-carbamoylputrescine amidase
MACEANRSENIKKAAAWIDQAAARGATLVCLQELFSGPYPCQSEDYAHFEWAETIPGPSSSMMSEAAKRHHIVVTGSIFEQRAHGLYHNTAVVYDVDGAQVGFYRKMHIPDDPLYYEKLYFTPGDTGFTVAETKIGKIGVGVCWDQWYPEAARLFAMSGAVRSA